MPTVRLTTVEGHSNDDLMAFMQGVTELCERTLGAQREAVIVHIEVLPTTRYMRGGFTIAERRAGKR